MRRGLDKRQFVAQDAFRLPQVEVGLLVALLQVHPPRLAVAPFEGDAPRALHGDGVPLGAPVQAVQPPDREGLGRGEALHVLQGAQARPAALNQIRPHAAGFVVLEQRGQAFVPEAADHGRQCSPPCDMSGSCGTGLGATAAQTHHVCRGGFGQVCFPRQQCSLLFVKIAMAIVMRSLHARNTVAQ